MATRVSPQPGARPETCRSESEAIHRSPNIEMEGIHQRSNSSYDFAGRLRAQPVHQDMRTPTRPATQTKNGMLSPGQERFQGSVSAPSPGLPSKPTLLTPPVTPERSAPKISDSPNLQKDDIFFDFTRIDYELDRARRIGSGLWSSVFLADPVPVSLGFDDGTSTPPTTPDRKSSPPSSRLFAVKCPARPDAKEVFEHEARILSHLQRAPLAPQHVVSFHGFDPRNSCLVFEGVIGGSLEDLCTRLKVMTELSRHLEIRQLFPRLALDLLSGLRFIHDSYVVHADIKTANILLDVVDSDWPHPVLRARYIDFSASFPVQEGSKTNAGATWEFMAPEQLRIQKDINQPTFASDIWSLGITLLHIIVGGSPYSSACGGNLFMLREAIKSGDPLSFARMDPVVHKRMNACQDFVDCCRLALQKDRDRRCTAETWEAWAREQEFRLNI